MTGVRLLVFARAPEPGRAKTRLAPALGAEGAARLHAALAEHALREAAASAPAALELWAAGADPSGYLSGLARRHGAKLRTQCGADLGARMRHALAAATADGLPAMIMGSDCPGLDRTAIVEAGATLRSRDAVIVPATDGGYVLLGVHAVHGSLFEDVPWGTEAVLATTRQRLAGLGWHWLELAPRSDIDRPEDLGALAALGPQWQRWAHAHA
jgi:hypothetical protein